MGKVLVSTELGGGGTARPDSIGLAKRGIRNFLVHAGVLHGRIEPKPSLQLDAPDDAWYVVSTTSGLIEFSVDLGQSVRAGILAGRHFAGPVQTGDLIALDVEKRSLTLKISEAELARRKKQWKAPPPRYLRGYGALHAQHITQADKGCDLDILAKRDKVQEPEIH